jgi:hypothetical protein
MISPDYIFMHPINIIFVFDTLKCQKFFFLLKFNWLW